MFHFGSTFAAEGRPPVQFRSTVVCAAPTDLEIKNRWPSGLTSRVRSSCRNPALWKACKLAPITPGKIGRAQEYYCLP